MTAELGQPGQIIDGKYRIVRLLGTGGMGAVYEGENLRIKRKVAIKMLHGSVSTQADVVARFEREAQAAALVGSEHICEVLDLGELADHTRYMVMEYLEGETLSGLIKKSGRLRPQQSIPILAQILEALGAAHTAGIIHRDLKPDNVFILAQRGGIPNFVKILDFGVSKFSQMGGESMNVTRAGAVVGTPYYMSPEQARGSSAIDQRTDIYAIGVLLYQATTGQVPYQAETFNELLFKIVLEVAPPPQTYVPDLDPEFAAIILRAMAREPDQRYQSCKEFRDALLQYQATRVNPLPAFALPGFPNDGAPAATQVLPGAPLPPVQPPPRPLSGGSWPGRPPNDPMSASQPNAQLGGSGPGTAPSPLQSGAQWAAAPVPAGAPVTTTANSWGNASSPSNAVEKPKSGKGMLVGVVGVAALLGIGGAIAAVVMLGKPSGGPTAAATTTPTAAPTAPATHAAPSTPAPATATAAPTTAPAAVTASASASASAAPAETASAEAAKPAFGSGKTAAVAHEPGTVHTATTHTGAPPGKSGTKGATPKVGNDLGY